MQTEIFEYITHKNQKVGVLIGMKINGEISIGWSLCGEKDEFNNDKAFEMAKGRAKKHKPLIVFINEFSCNNVVPAHLNYKFKILYPSSINRQMTNFIDRCKRYFKTDFIKNYEDRVMIELVANRGNTEFRNEKNVVITGKSVITGILKRGY